MPVRRIKSCEASEFFTGNIHHVFSFVPDHTAAAFYFSGFQIMGEHFFHVPAAALTKPARPPISVLRSFYHRKLPENFSCKIFRDISSAGCLFFLASAILHTAPSQLPCAAQDFIPAVTSAFPYNIPVLTLIRPLCDCQLSKTPAAQIFSSRHLDISFRFYLQRQPPPGFFPLAAARLLFFQTVNLPGQTIQVSCFLISFFCREGILPGKLPSQA